MTGHLAVRDTIAFVERHGYALLFFWVFAEQSMIPLPSIPLLLASGALIRAGVLMLPAAMACCVAGALIADTIWFQLGRVDGHRVLQFLCRISIEPDSCVKWTESTFLRHGMNSLLIAKFVPGLNTVTAPLVGNSAGSYWQFLLYDMAGACLWSGTYFAAGYFFSEQVEDILTYASRLGFGLFLLVGALGASWIAAAVLRHRRSSSNRVSTRLAYAISSLGNHPKIANRPS